MRLCGITCRKCAKRSGWLLAIPAILVPKCPLCLMAWLALTGTTLLTHANLVFGLLVLSSSLIAFVALWLNKYRQQRRSTDSRSAGSLYQ